MDTYGAIVVSISEDGITRFLVSDETAQFTSTSATIKRASHVEPDAYLLRVAFHGLRRMFGEHGKVSDFTRAWPCLWRVNLSPACGPILPGRWRNRKLAISAEIAWLNRNFI